MHPGREAIDWIQSLNVKHKEGLPLCYYQREVRADVGLQQHAGQSTEDIEDRCT